MREVKRIPRCWYFSKNLNYFQITLNNNQKRVFACKTEKAVDHWIKNIKEAIIFSEKNKFFKLSQQNNLFSVFLSDHKNLFLFENPHQVEIFDENPPKV